MSEEQLNDLSSLLTIKIPLTVATDAGGVAITIDTAHISSAVIPDEELRALADSIGPSPSIPISLDFLSQTRDGLTLLAASARVAALTISENGHLTIGIDVELSQDELPESSDDAPGGTSGRCGLPDQPAVGSVAFGVFSQSFLVHNQATFSGMVK